MLSDRSYMRSDYPRQTTSALTWILCATLAGGILHFAFDRFGRNDLAALLGLSPFGMQEWRIWSLATYVFLHGGLLHLLFNLLGLFFLGREIAPLLGFGRFIQFYAACAVLGGLAWLAVNWSVGGTLLGASACVAGLFILFACIYPEREITFLLFFVLPVTVKPKYLAWGLLGFDLLGLAFSELPGSKLQSNVAHSAHLGGMLAGWLYFRFVYANNGEDRAPGLPGFTLPAWLRRDDPATPPAGAGPAKRPGAPTPLNLRAEVDRILDKINSQGFGALTDEEKRILDDAKDMLSRR